MDRPQRKIIRKKSVKNVESKQSQSPPRRRSPIRLVRKPAEARPPLIKSAKMYNRLYDGFRGLVKGFRQIIPNFDTLMRSAGFLTLLGTLGGVVYKYHPEIKDRVLEYFLSDPETRKRVLTQEGAKTLLPEFVSKQEAEKVQADLSAKLEQIEKEQLQKIRTLEDEKNKLKEELEVVKNTQPPHVKENVVPSLKTELRDLKQEQTSETKKFEHIQSAIEVFQNTNSLGDAAISALIIFSIIYFVVKPLLKDFMPSSGIEIEREKILEQVRRESEQLLENKVKESKNTLETYRRSIKDQHQKISDLFKEKKNLLSKLKEFEDLFRSVNIVNSSYDQIIYEIKKQIKEINVIIDKENENLKLFRTQEKEFIEKANNAIDNLEKFKNQRKSWWRRLWLDKEKRFKVPSDDVDREFEKRELDIDFDLAEQPASKSPRQEIKSD